MSNRRIEDLLRSGIKEENLTPLEIESQISAVKDLVTVANQRLDENKIDRDIHINRGIGRGKVGVDKKHHTFEAFFSASQIKDVFIHIFTTGLPNVEDENDRHRLFIDVYCKSSKGTSKIVDIHTPKLPDLVGEQEALKLLNYKPEQLLQIAEIIKTTIPIERGKFYSFFKGPLPVKNR